MPLTFFINQIDLYHFLFPSFHQKIEILFKNVPRGKKYNAPNEKEFLTIIMLHIVWQNIILGLVYALNSKHFLQDFLMITNWKAILISNISCIISYVGNRKIIGTQNSLRHRFRLAAPKLWAQIRPWYVLCAHDFLRPSLKQMVTNFFQVWYQNYQQKYRFLSSIKSNFADIG